MFFRREKPRQLAFSDRLDALRAAGFAVESQGSGKARISKHGCAAVLEDRGSDIPAVSNAGVVIGSEIGMLVNGGYQQFFVTPARKKFPALSTQLRALHDFNEDLREALGEISYYNESLGTISDQHMYDRVEGRDLGGKQPTGTVSH
jgi:hypothetical protein